MEFTIEAFANKMIICIVGLSALVALGSGVFFHLHENFYIAETVPFAVGIALAMGLNITKVIWLKASINKTVDMDTPKAAKLFYQAQYFLRLVLTAAVLLVAALMPDNIVNLLGTIIGILTFPITMRLMQLFVPPDTEILKPPTSTNHVQDAIAEIEAHVEKEGE